MRQDETTAEEVIIEIDTEPVSAVNDRWKNRRRMAYTALYSVIITTIYVLVNGIDVTSVGGILTTFYGGMFSIILSYCGFSTWDDVTARRDAGDRVRRRYGDDSRRDSSYHRPRYRRPVSNETVKPPVQKLPGGPGDTADG